MRRISRQTVRVGQRALMVHLTRDLSESDRHIVYHILCCQLSRSRQDDGWVPMAYDGMRRVYGRPNVNDLVKRGLLEVKPHDRLRGLSRELRLPIAILREFISLGLVPGPCVDLFTGSSVNPRKGSRLYDDCRNPHPDVLQAALRAFNKAPVTPDWQKAKQLIEAREAHLDSIGWSDQKQVMRFLLDSASNVAMSMAADGNGCFINQYDITTSGRFSSQFGPLLQTRSMTAAMFGADSFNYDLVRAHDGILIQIFEDLNQTAGTDFKTDWLKRYAEDSAFRRQIAEKAGLKEETIKKIVHALKNGASLKAGLEDDLSIIRIIRDDVESRGGTFLPEEEIKAAHERLKLILAPLTRELDKFHRFLSRDIKFTDVDTTFLKVSHGRGRVFIRNGVGIVYSPLDSKYQGVPLKHRMDTRKLTSHILQGAESLIMKNVELAAFNAGILVKSDVHDGMITCSKIDETSINAVIREIGVRHASLGLKPFSLSSDEPELIQHVLMA